MAGRRAGSYSQGVRLLLLLERLRMHRTYTPLDALAAELEVSPRQLRRDLRAIEEAQFEVDVDVVDGRAAVRLFGRLGEAR